MKEENIKRHHKIDEQIVYTLLNNRKFIYKYILHSTISGFQPYLVISEWMVGKWNGTGSTILFKYTIKKNIL